MLPMSVAPGKDGRFGNHRNARRARRPVRPHAPRRNLLCDILRHHIHQQHGDGGSPRYPIGMSAAAGLGVSPYPFLFAVTVAASCRFISRSDAAERARDDGRYELHGLREDRQGAAAGCSRRWMTFVLPLFFRSAVDRPTLRPRARLRVIAIRPCAIARLFHVIPPA